MDTRRALYWFVIPAVVAILAVIVFPWGFTLWMSLFDWKIGSTPVFAASA